MSESQNIEFKQSWHDDYLKWICGFANAIGGIIYIGKNDAGDVVHLAEYKSLLESIPSKIKDSMGIICDVQLHDLEGSKYISIQVHSYSVPVSLRGRYYYRSGSSKLELTGVELNEFLFKKAGKTWDDVIEEGAKITDIDEVSLARFIKDSSKKGRLPDTEGLNTFQILEKLHLTDGEKLKRAAIILFGNNPMRFYPNIQVKIGRFGVDGSDLKFHEVVEGNLVQLINEVQLQLNYKFLTRPVNFEGFRRSEKDEYPVQALREMLLNALVHRTYMGASVQMRVFDNKLSIWNEGALPIGLSLEDLKSDHNSRPRNPIIANVCFLAGYIDTWGRGTLKIINSCAEAGLPEPEIIEKNGGISVTLLKNVMEAKLIELENFYPKFGTITDRINLGLEKNLLEFLGLHKTLITNIQDEFGINPEIVRDKFGINSKTNSSKSSTNTDVSVNDNQNEFGINSEEVRDKFGISSEYKLTKPLITFLLIYIYPNITAEEIGQILEVSTRMAEKYLKGLREDGLIVREGANKDGEWKIVKGWK